MQMNSIKDKQNNPKPKGRTNTIELSSTQHECITRCKKQTLRNDHFAKRSIIDSRGLLVHEYFLLGRLALADSPSFCSKCGVHSYSPQCQPRKWSTKDQHSVTTLFTIRTDASAFSPIHFSHDQFMVCRSWSSSTTWFADWGSVMRIWDAVSVQSVPNNDATTDAYLRSKKKSITANFSFGKNYVGSHSRQRFSIEIN